MEVYKNVGKFCVWPHPLPPVGGFPGNGDMYRKATKGKGDTGTCTASADSPDRVDLSASV